MRGGGGAGPEPLGLSGLGAESLFDLALTREMLTAMCPLIDHGPVTGLDGIRVNVYQRYRELDSGTPKLEALVLLSMQVEWFAEHS
jgi:hypothetical protein